MGRLERLTSEQTVESLGTIYSMAVFLVFVNGIGVPELPSLAYLFAVLLYIGGLATGYGFSMPE
jgi:hypothetical protein